MNIDSAQESLKPEVPLAVVSDQDITDRLDEAAADVAAGRVAPVPLLSYKLRKKYGLWESADEAIRQGLEDVTAGRIRPADEVFASIKDELAEYIPDGTYAPSTSCNASD